MAEDITIDTELRARRSGGTSEDAIHAMVARALRARGISGGVVVDLGCGTGALQKSLAPFFRDYIGVDAVRYDRFPRELKFIQADLNASNFPVESASADAVIAVETIEHLENPRALLREMRRIVKPGGWLAVTTPNQLSWLSLATLVFKRRFSAFQDVHYPAHITALLECDLRRLAAEIELRDVGIEFSRRGRVVFTALHYPSFISKIFPLRCSDNILLIGRAP